MLIFNLKAVMAVGIGIAAGLVLGALIKITEFAVAGGYIAAMLADVWMRYYSEDCDRPLIHPDAGGHVWFVPVWGVGIILTIIFGLMHFRIL